MWKKRFPGRVYGAFTMLNPWRNLVGGAATIAGTIAFCWSTAVRPFPADVSMLSKDPSELVSDASRFDSQSVSSSSSLNMTPAWEDSVLQHRFRMPISDNKPVAKPDVKKVTAPVSIGLILEGTMVDELSEESYAILSDPAGQEFVVKKGHTIPPPHTSVRLVDVKDRNVTVDVDGTAVTLTLTKKR
jgi:hypothetical protein